ncbi:MAG: hypothetical protein ABI743_15130 [bacterium]
MTASTPPVQDELDLLFASPPSMPVPSGFAHRVMAQVALEPRARTAFRGLVLPSESLAPIILAAVGIAMLGLHLDGGDHDLGYGITWTMVYGVATMVVLMLNPVMGMRGRVG